MTCWLEIQNLSSATGGQTATANWHSASGPLHIVFGSFHYIERIRRHCYHGGFVWWQEDAWSKASNLDEGSFLLHSGTRSNRQLWSEDSSTHHWVFSIIQEKTNQDLVTFSCVKESSSVSQVPRVPQPLHIWTGQPQFPVKENNRSPLREDSEEHKQT